MKRIKIAIVGSKGISKDGAKKLAKAILTELSGRYELKQIVTIKEDPVGRAVRKLAGDNIPLKTYSEARHADQSDAGVLTAAGILWSTKNYILIHDGSYSWAEHLREIIDRHPSRRYKLLEVDADAA